MTLGQKIKQLRTDKEMSQPDLAQLIGIEQSYLSKLENDKAFPSDEMFNQILKVSENQFKFFLSSFKNFPADFAALIAIPISLSKFNLSI